jgi:ABC-type multidrug transport system permease subunit
MIMPVLMPLMIFSGFLIPFQRIPWFFRWLYHLSFFQYGLNALLINEFTDKVFTDCSSGTGMACNITQLATQQPTCATAMQTKNLGGCWETGRDYLDARNVDPDALAFNFGILAAYFFASAFLAFLAFRSAVLAKCRNP